MPKTKNMYGVTYKPIRKSRNQHKHGNEPTPKSPIRSRWVNFLFFQIFVCLSVLMVSTNVGAQDPIRPTVDLSVIDTNGEDTVFNPAKGEDLRITVTVSVPENVGAALSYDYVIYRVDADGENITIGGDEIIIEGENEKGNQLKEGVLTATPTEPGTYRHIWKAENLDDGTYTIGVAVREIGGGNIIWIDKESATLDKVSPEITLGTDIAEFSPNGDRVLDTVNVYYSLSESVAESQLVFHRIIGEAP